MTSRLCATATAAILGATGLAADDIAEGRAIAERWCASCHVVAENQAQGADAAPAFTALAQDPARDADWLRAWIADPHPPMPDPGLSRAQIDAVVAYMGSLGK
jgi:mono/diheme cytochrome c family protein